MERYELLEQGWAHFNDLDPAGMVACSSGTAALVLAFEALELQRGSQVIMSDYNMVACPRAAVIAGLQPVFVDCESHRLLIDSASLSKNIGDRYDWETHDPWGKGGKVSACLVTQVYGREVEPYGVRKPTESLGIKIVEDLAEAHGIKPSYNANAACWSFYKNKVVAGEEGGCVWFRNPLRAKLARKLRCLGFTSDHDYTHVPRGHNYRLANCLADKILVSLADYHDNLAKRRDLEQLHNERCPEEWRMPERQVPWVQDLRIPGMAKIEQDVLVQTLRKEGIQARHGFKPMTSQKEFDDGKPYHVTNPIAYKAATEVIYLPLDPHLWYYRQDHVRGCWETIQRTLDPKRG